MASFTDVEFFPWAETPLEQLWNGEVYATKDDPKSWWSHLVMKWRNTVAMCGGKVVRLISTSPQRQGHPIFQVALPEDVGDMFLYQVLKLSSSIVSIPVSIHFVSREMGIRSLEFTSVVTVYPFKRPARI